MLVARTEGEVGEALIDWHTPAQLGIGVAAGALGISPLLATVVFIGISAIKLGLKEGADSALFEPEAGESHANELMDLTAKFVGYWVGQKARALIQKPPGPVLPPPVEGMSGKIAGTGMLPGDRAIFEQMQMR